MQTITLKEVKQIKGSEKFSNECLKAIILSCANFQDFVLSEQTLSLCQEYTKLKDYNITNNTNIKSLKEFYAKEDYFYFRKLRKGFLVIYG